METRVALISIIVYDKDSVEKLNALLHEYSDYIIGRMGIPYQTRGVNIISIALDAPADTINALTGALGRIKGITAKATYSNV
ncbi:MAG: iron-only hydrogenase system regulator [Lachnospiraceae bacterium]|nr:iron-only hydrogenase system regulator [Candidatus Minthocola equi]